MRPEDKVCVMGLWHLGSVTAACLAQLGYRVVGIDPDAERVRGLQQGQAPLYEPGLDGLLKKQIEGGCLTFTTDIAEATKGVEYIVCAFDTPVDDEDQVDTTPIFHAFAALIDHLPAGATIIVSSQVPVGTCEEIGALIREGRPGLPFGLAYCPENLRLGQALSRFLQPDLIVVGADDEATLAKVEKFWGVIAAPKVRMGLRSAEMTKHALNCFLATSISFANEMADLCDAVGADALAVTEALRLDQRIGPRAMLAPGLGFGGGHLARDLKVLQGLGQQRGQETALINAVLQINARRNGIVLRKLQEALGSLEDRLVAVLGLTYKAGTSTLHRSPALEIIRQLQRAGVKVQAYDPKADPSELRRLLPDGQPGTGFQFLGDPYEVAIDSDALVIITDWPQFRQLDFSRLAALMRQPLIVDSRNLLDPQTLAGYGFIYMGIGRGSQPVVVER